MRILVTNDDGIHAEGLAALERIARRADRRRLGRRAGARAVGRLAGADAVRAAAGAQARRAALRGLRHADRLRDAGDRGADRRTAGPTWCSPASTAATTPPRTSPCPAPWPARSRAWRWACRRSRSRRRWRYSTTTWSRHFESAEAYAPGIIERLLEVGWPKDVIININFPNRPPRRGGRGRGDAAGLPRHPQHDRPRQRTDLRGRDYYWMGFTAAPSQPSTRAPTWPRCWRGRISVTPLHIDLTHMPTVHALKAVLGGAPPKLRASA